MKPANNRAPQRRDWSALAQRALLNKDLVGARAAFTEALRIEPRNAKLHYELANVLLGIGHVEDAARHLTLVLRHNQQHADAARSLSCVLTRFVPGDPGSLDPFGLRAGLAFDTGDRQPLVEAAFRHLVATDTELRQAIDLVQAGDALGAARRLIVHRMSAALKHDLLTASLQAGVVTDPDIEQLFTALRRLLLLEIPDERFKDKALYAFSAALLVQGWNNDHAWAVSEPERAAVDQLAVDASALAAGDLAAARRLLLSCLYRSPEAVCAALDTAAVPGSPPKLLRDLIAA